MDSILSNVLNSISNLSNFDGFDHIEYLEVRNAETLAPIDGAARNARVFVAAHMGETRLIDNVAV